MKIIDIAALCHEANRTLCVLGGDMSQPHWDDAPDWQRESAIAGVMFLLETPDADPSHSHESWLKQKHADGWVHGEVKDPDKKTHPCIVPYDWLPPDQQAKDHLFHGIVRAMAPFVDDLAAELGLPGAA